MRQELERIWVNEPLAFSCHVTGWLAAINRNGKYASKWKFRFSKLLTAIRCRKIIQRKAKKAVDKV